jgi:hypothetical protein
LPKLDRKREAQWVEGGCGAANCTRDREHLTEAEVERLTKAAGENRYGHRDATMILIAFRHGLRPVWCAT